MAFSDPQSVTVNAVAQSMPRTSSGSDRGAFKKDDGTYTLSISHDYGSKATRRLIRLDNFKVAPDPLFPAQNTPYQAAVHLVVTEPPVGYTNAELKLIVDGFLAYLTASSGAMITKLLGGES